jgi:hypothetical protein
MFDTPFALGPLVEAGRKILVKFAGIGRKVTYLQPYPIIYLLQGISSIKVVFSVSETTLKI